jgi:Ca2+/Na+ antiporter
METILDEILNNDIYLLITAVLVIVLLFSAIKKITKLLLYSFVALAAFFIYLYYTGDTVAGTIEQGQEAVEEAKEKVDEKKEEIEAAKKKAEEQLKK